ncbi:MAG: heat-inducible transcriptional repressor HrcA [Holosporales bacterium]|jgi:heat-inducible transcriptional repressor|nr:heat-inducible transcriptional repressor HrcA [Holosporales bacterium]
MSEAKDFLGNKRYVDIFNELVDEYIETGTPVGSRTLSKRMVNALSPATIRNVMSDLEDLGILCSKHTSSGRKPTPKGWRYFIDSLAEVSLEDLPNAYREQMRKVEESAKMESMASVLGKISDMLSNIANCVSVITVPTVNDKSIRHIDFVLLSPGKALVVIVTDDGDVENRLIEVSMDVSNSVLEKASKYLNTKLCGSTLSEIRNLVDIDINAHQEGLDEIANSIVEKGIGVWTNDNDKNDRIIIKGQSNLLSNINEIENLQDLFKKLDEKQMVRSLLDESVKGKGIKVFIGAENKLFDFAGCSMIIAPYKNSVKKIIGAIGVIGPERMKYGHVITIVDYTAKMLEKLI